MVNQDRRKTRKRYLFLFTVILVIILSGLMSAVLEARVGGGHGYSGRSGSGNGGGGGIDGAIVWMIIRLLIQYPYIGIPVIIIIVVIYSRSKSTNPQPNRLVSSIQPVAVPLSLNSLNRDKLVAQFQREDANFSLPLFLDFAQLIYTHVMFYAGRGQLDKLAVYISQPVLTQFQGVMRGIRRLDNVIIGQCSLLSINLAAPDESAEINENYIILSFETNYTVEISNQPKPRTYFEHSIWTLARQKGVISRGPGEMNRIGCPNCGGSLDDNAENKCSYCGTEFHNGTMNWYVKTVSVIEKTQRSPQVSGGYAVEQGTNRPTYFQAGLKNRMAAFVSTYPDFNETAFYERVKSLFIALQEAWSSQQWEKARSLETDYLFQTHLYWINLYKKERVRNVLKDVRVLHIQTVKILSDAFFDAITVRIYASMVDYMENAVGQFIGGDARDARVFSEYWTLIRRSGVKESDKRLDQCPNCGNELVIGMAGKCNQCGSKITTGEFGWVLSMIEQDDSYAG